MTQALPVGQRRISESVYRRTYSSTGAQHV